MMGFFVGILVSLVAALPAVLLLWGGRGSEMKQRLKLWAIGTAVRFAIIGIALYYLFTQTDLARIPTVLGVAAAYFIIFLFETRSSLRV
jgi:hypothetical protein